MSGAFPLTLNDTAWYSVDPSQLAAWMEIPGQSPQELRSTVSALSEATEALEVCAWSGIVGVAGKLFAVDDSFIALTSPEPALVLMSHRLSRTAVVEAIRAQCAPGDDHLAMPAGSIAALSLLCRDDRPIDCATFAAMIGQPLFDELTAADLVTSSGVAVTLGPALSSWGHAFGGQALQLRRRRRGHGQGDVTADFLLLGPSPDRVLVLPDIAGDSRLWLLRLGSAAAMTALCGLVVPVASDNAV